MQAWEDLEMEKQELLMPGSGLSQSGKGLQKSCLEQVLDPLACCLQQLRTAEKAE